MANNSWNTPGLTKPIQEDVPHVQEKLAALLKQDPTSIEDIPVGAKRLVEISVGKWQLQQFNGESWASLGKLDLDVDTVDGYHAAITPNANTIAVRGADKKLQGDITGNAATATSATTLSETLPIEKGGTGATTSAAARANLGAAPVAHASSAGTYGLATDTNYGHVRSDGTTTKVAAGEIVVKDIAIGGDTADTASLRGQIGGIVKNYTIDDYDDATIAGIYYVYGSTTSQAVNRPPTTKSGFLVVHETATGNHEQQMYFAINGSVYIRARNSGTWGEWNQLITDANTATTAAYGITKLTSAVNSTSEVLAATPKAVKKAYDKAVAAYTSATTLIPAGTRMLFHQAAAPTGWTKQTTVNDATLRVVSGTTGGGTGGSVAFSTLFATGKTVTLSGNVGATTLTLAQSPKHQHATVQGPAYNDFNGFPSIVNPGEKTHGLGGTWYDAKNVIGTWPQGSSQSHTHPLSGKATIALNVKYTDVIICAKA